MNNISIHSIDTVCLKEACPVHHLCARFERYQKLRKSEKVFSILNPDHIACSEQGCAYRLQKKIIRMARGFRRMFGTIPSANTPHFWHFSPYISESTYCKAKRGAILIAPDMQQKLLRLFEQNGAESQTNRRPASVGLRLPDLGKREINGRKNKKRLS